LDTSFGQNGTVAIPDAYAGNNYSAMLARSDGSIVLELSEELISYNADGSVNSSLADNADAYLLNMSQDACGRIVVAGYTGPAVNTGETSYSIVSMRCVDPGQVQVIDPIAPQPVVSAPQAPVQVVQPVQTFSDFAAHQSLSLLGTQADGKTVWRGQTAFSGDSSYEVLFRFNADGTLDTTFGTGGQVDLQLNNFTVIFASAAQPDGKLLLAGNFHSLAGLGPDDLMLVRLNSDGTLDTSFGVNGAVVDQNVVGKYMSLQADGGIAIVGKDFATNNALVTRLNADGTVDTTFGQKGKVTLEYSDQTSANLTRVPDGGSFTEDTLLLLPDGKILMGGNADIFVGGTSEVAAILERYNADGTLDTTFGNNGVVSQIWSGSGSMIEGLAVQSDGKILAVGQTTSGQGLLERFNADGTLDATFGNAGTVLVDAIPSLDDVVVLSDGTIVTGAMANNQTLVTRYRADGSLDTSFGTNGTLTVETGLADAWGRLQVLGDGTLAVFGETTADLEKAAAPFETRIVGSTQSTIILGTSTHDLEAVPPAPPQTTAGLYDPITSTFLLRNSNDSGIADQVVAFGPGGSGDIPLTGDWTGSGIQSVGLYDPATSTFYLRNSNSSGIADTTLTFGPAHSHLVPIVGDWDGNGTDTVGLYDPASSMFYLTNSNTTGMATVTFVYGAAHGSQTPLVGDWTASGKDTVGLYDPASSMFFLKNQNTSGFADTAFVYGAAHNGGTPVAGNWTGSGSSAVGLYNPTTSLFYLKNANSTGIADTVFSYGAANGGLTPVVGAWELHFSRTAGQGTGAGTATLTQSDLQPIVNEAIALWGQAGLDAGAVKKLRQVQFIIGDLSSNQLGETNGDVVQIDANAAGYGWFVDPTPTSNEEFSSPAGSSQLKAVDPQALDHIDLLTVVEHELGHVAGLGDLSGLASDIMNGVLGAGVRRLASATDAALVS
jgi:uncharacterized delta-60 repeat protein